MGSSTRRMARKRYKFAKKKAEDALTDKLTQFDRLGDKCLICDKAFDKRNKAMVQSWNVVIASEKVNLYCPKCWKRVNTTVNVLKETTSEQN